MNYSYCSTLRKEITLSKLSFYLNYPGNSDAVLIIVEEFIFSSNEEILFEYLHKVDLDTIKLNENKPFFDYPYCTKQAKNNAYFM